MPPNFCPNCGIKIKADDSDCCPKCGIKIGSRSPQTSTQSLQPLTLDSSSQIPNPSEKNGVAEVKGNKRNWFKITIVLYGFVIIAVVFAFVVFGAGFFTPQTSQPNIVTTIPTPTPTAASLSPSRHRRSPQTEDLLSGPEKSNYFKDLGNFHRKCRGGYHKQCGWSGSPILTDR